MLVCTNLRMHFTGSAFRRDVLVKCGLEAGGGLSVAAARARQVKRAQAHLLEQLYSHLSTLSGGDTEALLEEDPEVSQRRARCKQAREPRS